MRVQIRNSIKEIQVTSVVLHYDLTDPDKIKLKMFFCPNCQNPVAQYNGHVSAIMPGKVPVDLPVYHKCSNCGNLYLITSVV